MNVSYRWLRALVPGLELSPEEVAEHLAQRGAPVEEMHAPGALLGDVVVARVVTSGKHPNADRLSVCSVDAGGEPRRVVCGAPNVKAGSWYPFAPVGAVLPGGVEIKKAKIRGEPSEGMLCSPRELGLGADHSGIMEIFGDFTPGGSFVEAMGLDDVTMDVEVTANRGDLLSHLGVARELASEGSGDVGLPPIPGDPGVELEWKQAAPEVAVGAVRVCVDDADLCSRYLGAVIRGVQVGPSPAWLQERLRGAGARPINNVVDATNYVMLELGQPLHAFDLSRLGGPAIVVRRAGPKEKKFTTLDEVARKLTPDMLMICDAERPVALAGIMGGLDSEVDDHTTDVLVECALFNPKSIRATRRELGMSTDASYRFERGVDPAGMRRAVERAVALILATAGGSVDGPVLDACPRAFEASVVGLRLARVERVLGVPFTAKRVRALLEPLGFIFEGRGQRELRVRVPGWRSYDVTREIDLIEEIARTHGYDTFPSELAPYRPGTVPDHPMFQLEDELRGALVGLGLYEAQTPAFVSEAEGDVRVANPLNTQEPFMRRMVLPSLLRRVEHNFARGNENVRLFEIATSFHKAGKGEPPAEETHVAGVLTGTREAPHWSRPAEPLDVWDLKGLLEEVTSRVYRGRATLAAATGPTGVYEAGLAFVVRDASGTGVGMGGRVHDGLVDAPVWAGPVWGFEITLPDQVVAGSPVTYRPLPQYPAVDRDLALLVPDALAADTVLGAVRERAEELLEDVRIFDVYRGEELPAGTRSVAIRLRFRAPERTLKDKEVDRVVQGVLGRLKEELGVQARG